MIICLFARLWNDFHGSIAHRVQCGANDFGGIYKPLIGQHGFNDHFGTIAKGLHDGFVFHVWDQVWFVFFACFGVGDHDGIALGRDGGDDARTRL